MHDFQSFNSAPSLKKCETWETYMFYSNVFICYIKIKIKNLGSLLLLAFLAALLK